MRPFLAIPLAFLAACAASPEPAPDAMPVGIANPASVYCGQIGGRLEIRRETRGDAGYCHLPDGRVIEEWTLFRRDHPQP